MSLQPAQPADDHELLEGLARRDAAAMRRLFDRYAPVMLAVARRVLRDAHEAEDVVNEVFLELWQRPERFVAERGSPRTYLFLVTRSRAIDRLRSRASAAAASAGASLRAAPAPTADPADASELADLRRHVRRQLDDLPAPQREAVELAFFEGLTHQQIAERTREPLGTVKGRVRQGLIRLRESLRITSKGESS